MKAIKIRPIWFLETLEIRRVLDGSNCVDVDSMIAPLCDLPPAIDETFVDDGSGAHDVFIDDGSVEFDPTLMFTTGMTFGDDIHTYDYTYDENGNAFDADGNLIEFKYDDSEVTGDEVTDYAAEWTMNENGEFIDADGNVIEIHPYWRTLTGETADYTKDFEYDPSIAESGIPLEGVVSEGVDSEGNFYTLGGEEVQRTDMESTGVEFTDSDPTLIDFDPAIAQSGVLTEVATEGTFNVFSGALFDAVKSTGVFAGNDLIVSKSDLDQQEVTVLI